MDMTKEMLTHFTAFAPTDSAIYHVGEDGSLETLYLSENIPALLNMTREEYLEITKRDAMDLTLPGDRPGLRRATADCLRTGKPFDYYYRVFHNKKGFEWVHVHAHVCGLLEGRPLILALFANMTAEGGIYQQILDASDRKTLVIDRDSFDILYANEPAAADGAGRTRSLLDQTCHGFLHGLDAPCEGCVMREQQQEGNCCEEVRFDSQTDKWERLTRRFISWCGHRAMLVYIKDITAEKNAELETERFRKMYADAMEEAKLIVWNYVAEKRQAVMLWDGYTKEICEKLGVPRVIENVPDSLVPFVDPRDRAAFIGMYRDIDNGATHGSCEFRFQLPKQAQPQCERAVASAIFDGDGRKLGVYCFGQNITAQKQEEEKYRLAFEELGKSHLYSLGTYRLNLTRNSCEQEENPTAAARQIWQSGPADDFFKTVSRLIDDEAIKEEYFRKFNREALLDAFAKGTEKVSLEYPSVWGDGERRWREGLLFMMRNPRTGDVEGVTYAMDINARKRGELVLQRLIHENFDYIGIIHPEKQAFEFVSRRSWINYGETGALLDYEKCCDYVRSMFSDAEELKYFNSVVSISRILEYLKNTGQASVTYFRTTGGKAVCSRLVYCWLERPGGDILVIRSDITDSYEQEQKRLAQMKQALAEADRANEAKSTFLSTMSHDLHTPLNGVLSFTDFALKESDPAKKQSYLEKVKFSGNLLLNLVNDTLELSRIESGKAAVTPETVSTADVGPAVVESLRPFAEAKGVKLVFASTPDRYIFVDKLKFQKIWLNLLSNAIKYTPAGGAVRACVEPIEPPQNGRNRRMVVEDTGIGMSEEFMRKMYEPFTQENRPEAGSAGGTGLGLAIVKRLANLMGGTITVHSKPGAGSRFEIEVPVTIAVEPEAEFQSRQTDVDLKGKRVLLCEDNLLNREIVVTLLENRGVSVDCSENGSAGLNKFKDSPARWYDAVLMDIRMPVMDGCEATRAMRALDRADSDSIPIIALSADAFEESIQLAKNAGMNGYLAKPVVPERLYEELSKVFEARAAFRGRNERACGCK